MVLNPDGIFEIDRDELRGSRMRRNTLTAARLAGLLPDQGDGPDWWAMVTLTYREDDAQSPRDITQFHQRVRAWLKRRGVVYVYVWVAELTKRGRMHYHVGIRLPKGTKLPKPDEMGWWTHGSTQIVRVRKHLGYLAKYMSKVQDVNRYPKGFRISGFGGLDEAARRERRWWASPSYVRETFGEEANPFRAEGGGWTDRETGEYMPSRYRMVGRGVGTVRLVDLWASDRA